VQSGSSGQHGLTQYCVEPVQLVEPHGMLVVPLDPPELVVEPELDVVPELLVVVPELDDVIPELLVVVPELLDVVRPLLEAPLDPVCCWLL
jgi:hypothetical protein